MTELISNGFILLGVALFYFGAAPSDRAPWDRTKRSDAASGTRTLRRIRRNTVLTAIILLSAGFLIQVLTVRFSRLDIVRLLDRSAEGFALLLIFAAVIMAASWWHATDRMHRYRWQKPDLYRLVDFRQDIGLSARTNMVALGMIALAFILCALAA